MSDKENQCLLEQSLKTLKKIQMKNSYTAFLQQQKSSQSGKINSKINHWFFVPNGFTFLKNEEMLANNRWKRHSNVANKDGCYLPVKICELFL